MKVNADHHPGSFTKTHGKLWFNKNIVQSTETDEMTGDVRTVFNYDQFEITPTNEAEIIKQAGQDGKYLKEFKADKDHHFKSFKNKLKAKSQVGTAKVV